MDYLSEANTAPTERDQVTSELLPMSVGDVFDEAFDLYKRNFALFAGIVAVVSVPLQIVTQAATVALGLDRLASRLGESDPSVGLPLMLGFMVVWFVEMAVFTFGHVIQSGALTVAVSERYLGRTVTLGHAYRQAWRRIGALLLTWLLALALAAGISTGILLIVSMAAGAFAGMASVAGPAGTAIGVVFAAIAILLGVLAAAGVFVFVGLFTTQIVMIEGIAYAPALDRNRLLLRSRLLRIVVAVMLLWVIQLCLWGAFWGSLQLVLEVTVYPLVHVSAVAQRLIGASISAVVMMLLEPFWLIAVTLLYYDQRVRREGFDMTVLERQVIEMLASRSAR